MKHLCSLSIAACLALTPHQATAETYNIEREITLAGDADEIWQAIGDFCDIDDWHPGISGCALKAREGAVFRRITVGKDAEVWEKLIAVEPGLSYTYRIVESPFPIKRYVATISITRGTPNRITWSGKFKSDDPKMEKAVTKIYENGLAAIANRFTQ